MGAQKPSSKSQSMSLGAAVAIGIGGMVGGGIYSLLGTAVSVAGNAVYISFALAGVVALFSAYSYAKLGARYPSAGGPVEFLIQGFGDGMVSGGFNVLLWVGYVFALALYARAFGAYLSTFFPALPTYWQNIFATAIIVLFTGVNFLGSKAVGRSELVIVAANVGFLLLFAGAGFFFLKPALLSPAHWPHVNKMLFAAGVVFLTYEGFGLVTNTAEDMEDPQKTLPQALYLSVGIVIFLYIAVSVAVVGNLAVPQIVAASDYAAAAAAKAFLGEWGLRLVAFAALFATASAINATLYGGANVSYTIARDGELPEIFERKVWERSTEGLFITAALVIVFANAFNLDRIGMMGSAAFLLIYAAVSIGHLRIYRETGARPAIIVAAVVACLAAFVILSYYLWTTTPMTLVVLAAVLVASFGVEWLYRLSTHRQMHARAR